MFQEILAENGTKFIIAAAVVLLGLLCLALVLWIIRGRPSSPFIRGGRNRTPRLAVLDAAAIDTRRRLVLLRRDDVEHLVMIGGPTDIVIESRIVTAPAESAQPVEKPVQKTERAEPAPVLQETPVRTVETPVVTRTAAAATTTATERRPAAAADGVSAMGKVLYENEDTAARPVPARTVTQPVTAIQALPQTGGEQRVPERRVEDMLEQNRQRVLSPQTAATAQATTSQAVQRPVMTATVGKPVSASVSGPVGGSVAGPVAGVADNAALVSEFERILEAEMANNAAAAGVARPAVQPIANPTQTAAQTVATTGQAQPVAKSREETEAEMARLLGEIAANRKA
ncbi:flagellar biosynthetic protein FliO [Shinella sp. G-2]|uniref:flagellar biosynthetic protein FliO n=1 Tax=Shinella sp. G-2 TaxID=3133141 RepID=UPI003CFDEE42